MPVIPGVETLTQVPKILEGAKLAFVLAMRQAFSSTITDPNLRYTTDNATTKIKIFTAYPLRPEFFPSIIVSASNGDASFRYLQDDFVGEDIPEGIVHYAGQLSFTISLTVLTKSTLERERLIDHIILFIRHIFRDVLHGYNLEYTHSIRVGAESITEVENQPVYEQTIDIPCYMEYHADIDQSALETIRRINIKDISVGAVIVTD